MKTIEDNLLKRTKIRPKFARIVSYILAVFIIVWAVVLVFLVVIPQLGETFVKLGQDIMEFWPVAQAWMIEFFKETPEIQELVYGIEFDFQSIIDKTIINFSFRNRRIRNGTTTYTQPITEIELENGKSIVFFCSKQC